MTDKKIKIILIIFLPIFFIFLPSCGEITYKINSVDKNKIIYLKSEINYGVNSLYKKINFCLNATNKKVKLNYFKIKPKNSSSEYVCFDQYKISNIINRYIFLRECLIDIKNEITIYKIMIDTENKNKLINLKENYLKIYKKNRKMEK